MDKNKNNTIDEVFKSKLYDFEMDTNTNDWKVISDRLDKQKPSVYIKKYWYYWAIAGVISLLITIGSFYQYGPKNTPEITHIVDIKTNTENETITDVSQNKSVSENLMSLPTINKAYRIKTKNVTIEETIEYTIQENNINSNDTIQKQHDSEIDNNIISSKVIKDKSLIAENHSVNYPKKQKTKKWGFGMGGGGLTTGSENVVNSLMFKNTYMEDDKMMAINSVTNQTMNGDASLKVNDLKTNINHKTPITFGLSVSRYLNNHFSFQTGLTYSMLNSEWEQNGVYHAKTKQRLHLVGVPLSITYKIAEWERLSFYGSAGILTEINVAGELQTKSFTEEKQMEATTENIRMKEPLFSLNSRVGVSYPLIKFVSAFTEVGASYYFDNGSKIETIHSEKPLNVSLQVGVRFGF